MSYYLGTQHSLMDYKGSLFLFSRDLVQRIFNLMRFSREDFDSQQNLSRGFHFQQT